MSQHQRVMPPPRRLTKEGLPLDHAQLGAVIAPAQAGDDGPSRRIDCSQPQMITSPSTLPPKGQPSDTRRAISLDVGPIQSSLTDDDDEVVDYFDAGGGDAPSITNPAIPADTASPSPRWNVREHHVPFVPRFYPLEKSSVFVPRASAPILAARVAAVLRARSVAASYDAANAKADCVSKSSVEFRVRLYRGRGDCGHSIIVEVQRRSGFDLSYARDVYAILDAVEGKDINDFQGEITTMYYDDNDSIVNSEEWDADSLGDAVGFTSLQVISNILCPRDKEAEEVFTEWRDLALSSLVSLTSQDSMGQKATLFSGELLASEVHADLWRALSSNVGQDHPSRVPQRVVLQSLAILANVACSAHSCTQFVDLLSKSDYGILLKLIGNVENAVLYPHAADLSCLALASAYKPATLKDTMPSHYKERLLVALAKAIACGRECHAELEMHSWRLLKLLQLNEF